MATESISIGSPASFSTYDPMGDLDELEIQQQESTLSEHGEMLAKGIQEQSISTTPKKRAYFVVTAKEGDPALRTPERDQDREMNMEILRKNGYEVTLFKTNRAFFDHIQADHSPIDLLIIADHGSPIKVGKLKVEGESIVIHDETLTQEERTKGFQLISSLMNKDSILLFHACLAGNKTIENNIARVASRITPETDIYACQYVTLYEPGFQYKLDDEKGVVIDTINYGYAGQKGMDMLELVSPAIYRNGKELTRQAPVPLPPPSRRPLNLYKVGSVAFTMLATIVSAGIWYYNTCANGELSPA